MRALLLLLLVFPAFTATIEIHSDRPRTNAIVRLNIPHSRANEPLVLRAANTEARVQSGVAIIPLLKQGANQFEVAQSRGGGQGVSFTTNHNTINFSAQAKPAFSYYFAESELPRENIKPIFKRGGYIHPLRAWSGVAVTDDYPANHVHHHGVWNAWTKTDFEGRAPDFWNMGQGIGTVISKGLAKAWSGPVHGGFVASLQQVDLTSGSPKAALDETWEVTTYASASPAHPFMITDLVITQQTASNSPLKLPKYHYGGLGFRGRWEWNGASNTFFLTSEGITNRVRGNETSGRWCAIAGPVEGGYAGAAILCHPSNFRAPQPMRLHPTEPFFCYAPSQGGDWEITPGKPYISKYRLVTFDGLPQQALIEEFWHDYANPATSKPL